MDPPRRARHRRGLWQGRGNPTGCPTPAWGRQIPGDFGLGARDVWSNQRAQGCPEALAMPGLEPLTTWGERRSRRTPGLSCRPRLPLVCCCQSPAEVCPAQAILAGTVCLANLMSPKLNAWQILT